MTVFFLISLGSYAIFALYKIIIVEIIFKYSIIWVFLIAAASLGLSALLYYKNKREDFPLSITIVLSFLRFIVFFLLGLYLLSPMIKSRVKEVKKPVILFALDNSNSIVSNADSVYYNSEYQKDIDRLIHKVSKKYRVDTYVFGESLKKENILDFSEKSTDLSQALTELDRLYKHKNVGALILASDGIYNRGQNPVYSISGLNYPVYTIALGDTAVRRDLVLNRLATNKLVFLGDRFPVEVKVTAKRASGYSSVVSLFMDGKLIDKKSVAFKSDFQQQVIKFSPKAVKIGIRKLTVRIKPIDKEYNKANNSSTVFIEVVNVKQKILITYQSPHPDIGAIVRSLKTSDNYEVTEKLFSDVKQIADYNLVIYHNIPANRSDLVKMKNLISKSVVPYIIIAGSQLDLFSFNQLKTGVRIDARKHSSNEVQPVFNPDFEMYSVSSEFKDLLVNFPPVLSPFGKYRLSDNVTVVLSQKIGNVVTHYPLIAVANTLGNMHAVVLGEGIWRWWLYDYQLNGNHQAVDEFMGKLIKMVSLKINKEKFSVDFRNIYTVMEDIEFRSVMHNAAFEAITDPDVMIIIKDLNRNKEYDYTFSKGKSSYFLNAGRFESGEYSFKISTVFEKKSYSKTGRFVVQDVNTEQLSLEANHRVLFQLSELSQGMMFYPDNIQDIANQLEQRNDLVNVEYVYLKYSDIIDIGWLLLVLVVLIGGEWFLRKYYGSY